MMNLMRRLNGLERVGTLQNTIPDVLERYGLFNKSKARVAKHDDQSKEHHHETLEWKLKQELELKAKDHDSKRDKTVASLLAQLHDERIITVREEPNLHIVFYQRDVPNGMRTPWNTHIKIRVVVGTFFLVQHSGEWLNMELRSLVPGVACSAAGSSRSAQSLCPCTRATSASACSECHAT